MSFSVEKHIRYWRMCSQNLPNHYMSNDSNRVSLGFFIVSALDLLSALDTISQEERQSWISWIYSCQVPEGGFRGFTGTDFRQSRSAQNKHWDPANVPATFFALATLLILGDDLSRVKREECLTWLPKLQREDGSFGELLMDNETIEGDRDLRQCCCAAGIAYMLQDRGQSPIFDEKLLVSYIQSCQSQSGGFGVSPLTEAHSGLSYCAIAALSFVTRIQTETSSRVIEYIPSAQQCLKWFLERQTSVIDDDANEEDEDEEVGDHDEQQADPDSHQTSNEQLGLSTMEPSIAGFSGRDGKIADTCYAFWNTGALAILEKESLIDHSAMRSYLLEITQHRIGGFGKGRDDPPDVLHSYLGLAALGLFGEPGVQTLDPTMCISLASAKRLERVSWKLK